MWSLSIRLSGSRSKVLRCGCGGFSAWLDPSPPSFRSLWRSRAGLTIRLVIPRLCYRRTSITTSRRSTVAPGFAPSLTCTWWYTVRQTHQRPLYASLVNLSPCPRGYVRSLGAYDAQKGVAGICSAGTTLLGRNNTCVGDAVAHGFRAWAAGLIHSCVARTC